MKKLRKGQDPDEPARLPHEPPKFIEVDDNVSAISAEEKKRDGSEYKMMDA